MKFLHTMVRVSDIEKSLKFYQELLDMKLARKKELEGKGATLYFLSDDEGYTQLELTHNHELPEGGYTHGTFFGHLAFEVKDLESFTQKLNAFGWEYVREPFVMGVNGTRIAFIKDPDGLMIELIEKNFQL